MRRTGNRLWLAAGVVAMSVWPGVAFAAGSITGTITFDGKAPVMKALAMDADPVCAKKHPTPALSERLVLGTHDICEMFIGCTEFGGCFDVVDAEGAGLRPSMREIAFFNNFHGWSSTLSRGSLKDRSAVSNPHAPLGAWSEDRKSSSDKAGA